MPSDFTLTTLGYVRRGEAVLLLERGKAPNLGEATAPGGKLLPGESPDACVRRELAEETGAQVTASELRAVITQTADDPAERWMLFIYFVEATVPDPLPHCAEGRLFWCPIPDLVAGRPNIPPADRVFTPWLFESGEVVRATFWHGPPPTFEVRRYERW